MALCLVLLSGCKGSSSQQEQELRKLQRSWTATRQLVTELKESGAVPVLYADQVIAAGAKELEKAVRKAKKSGR